MSLFISRAASLIALSPDVQPAEFELDAACEIGRAASRHIVVRRDTVSRLHAVVERLGENFVLRDCGSANGTYVNRRRIDAPYILKDRDQIALGIGPAVLRFVDPDPTRVVPERLRYDEQAMSFFWDNRPMELTAAQWRLLHCLYERAGQVCPRAACAQAVWGRDYDPAVDADALDKVISKLRGRLRAAGAGDILRGVRGIGYVLEIRSEERREPHVPG